MHKATILLTMKYLMIICSMIMALSVNAQDIVYDNYVYLDHIKSVKFHHSSLATSEPIIDLNSNGRLLLTFDDMLGGDRDYTYRIVHCDKDWNPSTEISEMDYLVGFNDEEIRDYEYSNGTKVDYTNYQLAIPNDDIGWSLSGNYLLIVTDDDSDELALTRRFMVSDRKVTIGSKIIRSTQLNRMLYDQEIEMFIDNKNYPIGNPQSELFITILQNGRWDNAYTNVQPRVASGNKITFDRTARFTFPGYNQFRGADLRAFRSRGLGVYSIDIYEDEINILLDIDIPRGNVLYQNYEDINGDFVIETSEYSDDRIRSEYVNTYFTLESKDRVYDGDVYVIGAFTNWQADDDFRLEYDVKRKVYRGSSLMKQGYYDYQYMVKYDDGSTDCEYFEGSHYATRNQYHILVYQRSFNERYDELISVSSFESVLGY